MWHHCVYHRACVTCGRTPKRHKASCTCQDFQMICKGCKMKAPPGLSRKAL